MAIHPYIIERMTLSNSLLLDSNEHYRQWVKLPDDLLQNLNRYPDNTASELRTALADNYARYFSADNLLITAGSIEAIDVLMRSLQPEKLILSIPTYDMYSHCASAYNIPTVEIPYTASGQPNVTRILTESTADSMLVVVHPNNPTGQLVSAKNIHDLVDNFTGTIVIDEAYIEYAGMHNSMERWVLTHANMIILRTFSKAWGLAGLRIGYVIAAAPIIKSLSLHKNAYTVNVVALNAAICALEQVNELASEVRETLLNKEELRLRLVSAGIASTNTSANFLLINLPNAQHTYRALLQQGIVIRKRKLAHDSPDCLRITIGTSDENDIFFNALIRTGHGRHT